ncbi:2,3-bisphosphoglycerate-independent phosphoglycerate mutase [Candidatus Shikimatogenerans silvanidophilus]|uniref:2,3-bisphosphoglycerate-independent phosphoglycerate mutase n=1 Tax=Candidatus Shikimatogenerans silvanidophilus TaxID=2782547 RepID=UPI001BAB5D16|nr:2,3-bisphosphoglycerate-independent phosphoglycerate mutase [Candidatus Shikimatogenerans silvanidophilus]
MKKVLLIILDGWGISNDEQRSAIKKKNTKFINNCLKKFPNIKLHASGKYVGLPINQVGNSEVGHLNIGSGRIIKQKMVLINDSIKNNYFEKNIVINNMIKYYFNNNNNNNNNNNKNIHLIGLLSDGGVHSHIDHLLYILKFFLKKKCMNVFIHIITDGRDTYIKSGLNFIKKLQNFINKYKIGIISTICGRYYAMDRDNRWERTKIYYDSIVNNIGNYSFNIIDSIKKNYENGITDEFIKPIIFINNNKIKYNKIKDKDIVFFFNYRSDRMRQISNLLLENNKNLYYVTMTKYDKKYENVNVIFEEKNIFNTIGEVLSNNNKKQLRIAETEKYPHVTYFFSGGLETCFKNEKRILCPSPKVKTYDLKPEMSLSKIYNNIYFVIKKNLFDFICLNFANPDMVGHTGNMKATIQACKKVDEYVNLIYELSKKKYIVIIISDHGNAECMLNKDGTINTYHTSNLVPCIILNKNFCFLKKKGKISDIAPSILKIMDIDIPKEMTSEILLKKL